MASTTSPQPKSQKSPSLDAKASTLQLSDIENDKDLSKQPSDTETAHVDPPSPSPGHDRIADLAYGYWLDRQHSGEGSPEQDWLRAEQELRLDEPIL